MKRFFNLLLVGILIVFILPVHALAKDNSEIICLNDGGYIVVTVNQMDTRVTMSKNGSKTYTYYDGEGSNDWVATLYGTFTYDGSSATCTASRCKVTIYDSAWYTVSESATKSGDTAYASITMGEKLAGITVKKVPIDMSLQCDSNGNLS